MNSLQFRLILLLLLILPLGGCVKNEFTVEFEIAGDVNDTYTLTYYASDSKKGFLIETAATLHQGKAQVKCITRNPSLVYLMSGGRILTFFYVERGDKILITGTDRNPTGWDIGGNKINEQLSEWRMSHKDQLQFGKSPESVNNAVADYVTKNSDSPVATLLLLEYYDRRVDEDGFVKLWKKLKGDATDGKWQQLVSRSDMLEDVSELKMPRQIVLNTVATGCDTIVPARVATLLYFYQPERYQRDPNLKKLRQLSKETGDSSRRVIASISFDTDSMSRWQSARTDSLRGIVEGWMPLGISDPIARELGVRRVPYVIVIKGGKAIYRGDDLEKAIKIFR